MSEQDNNICEICGGWKRIAYTIEFRECMPHSISVDPSQLMSPFKLCPGHPEPAQKHDGRLVIRYGEREFMVRARQGDFVLSPVEALALLAELERERETLERLGSEQER